MAQSLNLQIDPLIVDKLKTRAKRNSRSLEAELRVILEEAATPPKADIQAEAARVLALSAGRAFAAFLYDFSVCSMY